MLSVPPEVLSSKVSLEFLPFHSFSAFPPLPECIKEELSKDKNYNKLHQILKPELCILKLYHFLPTMISINFFF